MQPQLAAGETKKIEVSCSRHFLSFLKQANISLAVSTYQTNRLFLLGLKENDQLSIFERHFDRAMGLYADSQRLYLSTRYQIHRFDNALNPGETDKGYDRLFIPRAGYTTGDLDIHDMAIDRDGRLVFVSTLYSCLATLSERHSFEPLWRPPFISKLAPEDRCHLNGMAMEEGRPRYATAVSRSDVAGGWRERRHQSGCLIDIANNDLLSTNLSMPHSPRLYRGRLWLANSGTGEFGWFDVTAGRFEPVAFCPGYIRGMAFYDQFALVGLSMPRHNKVFSGLALDGSLQSKDAEPSCGIMVIDLENGNIVHWLKFEGGLVTELYDLQVLPGVGRPFMLGFKNDEIQRVITFEQDDTIVRHTLSAQSPLPSDPGFGERPAQPLTNPRLSPASAEDGEVPEYRFEKRMDMGVDELISTFSSLTHPPIRNLARVREVREPLISIACTGQSGYGGLLIGEIISDESVRIISLFVRPEYRGKGLATRMLSELERAAASSGRSIIEINYRTDQQSCDTVERLLRRCGWQSPQMHSLRCKTDVESLARAPWIHQQELPANFAIFSWKTLSSDERRTLERSNDYNPVYSPFCEEERIEWRNSVGLRFQGQVVGWMITHRAKDDTIQYSTLFVRADLRGSGLGTALLGEAIRRQMHAKVPMIIFMVHAANPIGLKLTEKRLKPYLRTMVEARFSYKLLAP